jgi:hypothetical protein
VDGSHGRTLAACPLALFRPPNSRTRQQINALSLRQQAWPFWASQAPSHLGEPNPPKEVRVKVRAGHRCELAARTAGMWHSAPAGLDADLLDPLLVTGTSSLSPKAPVQRGSWWRLWAVTAARPSDR